MKSAKDFNTKYPEFIGSSTLKKVENKKKPHRNAAIVKNHSGSVTPKENELNIFSD